MSPDCVGILLAAGQGRRFGGNKLLHPLADGTPLVVASERPLRSRVAPTSSRRSTAGGADTRSVSWRATPRR